MAAEDDAPEALREFREFREAVKRARAEAVARNVALVQKAADDSEHVHAENPGPLLPFAPPIAPPRPLRLTRSVDASALRNMRP